MRFNDKLDGTLLRMVEDDTFFDVTSKDVSTLLNRMPKTYSREDVIRIRMKYDAWIDDGEKRFMQRLGIDYENHHIIRLKFNVPLCDVVKKDNP